VLGRIAESLMLERHMRRLIERRNLFIKRAAESDQYREYLAT